MCLARTLLPFTNPNYCTEKSRKAVVLQCDFEVNNVNNKTSL